MLNKDRAKNLIHNLQVRAIGTMMNDLVYRVPKKITLEKIKTDLIKLNKTLSMNHNEVGLIWSGFISKYDKLSKSTYYKLRKTNVNYKNFVDQRSEIVYSEVKRSVMDNLDKDKNRAADLIELRRKDEDVKKLLSSGVFYLCSSHLHPAKDHKDHEGKVYVHELWESRCSDEDKPRVRAYIRNHQIQTVQYIVGPPVYLIYRPNCKHYLVEISVEEVLHNSARGLLKKYNMFMSDDKTLTYQETIYKNWYEKFKSLKILNKMCPCKSIRSDMKKIKRVR